MLGASPVQIKERLFFKQKATVEEVRTLAALLPGGARDILSTRSRRFKELGLAERELSDEELLSLLAAEPGLWRRPIIVRGSTAVVGLDAKSLGAFLA